MEDDYPISDYNYIGSSVGNAFFSGLTFDQLWECVAISETREQLDAAVSVTIRLNNMTKGIYNG
jgi:hypothetical protein